ncbi:MAG TPA: RICIN domain-containing protein [Streptosporangiaceae bacterium]|nr:RICIN domain-containing protein [Streptosporangiaceae bacterium]
MFKRIFALAAAASLSVLGATAAAQAQAQPHARPAGHLHGVRVINLHRAFEARLGHTKAGKISGIVYARGHRPRAAASAAAACTEPACPVTWQGGLVQHTPHVYLLLWGPNWKTDPTQEASATYLENFFSGLGNGQADDNWSTITSQYADGTGAPVFSGLVYEGAFNDINTPPTGATAAQLAAEADTFVQNNHITDTTDAQIVVATQSGTCPKGFAGTSCPTSTNPYCAYHSASLAPYINLPYLPDAGAGCAEDFVNPAPGGNNDGFSIIGGALYAGTITDPFGTGWFDTATGGEIGDQCARIPPGSPGGAFNLTLSTSTTPFAMEDLWSNAAGGCVATGAVKDSIKITSPGNQTSNVGASVNVPIVGTSTAGNPLAWSAAGLPNGLGINATTGTVTGTPTTPGISGVTVTATDKAGATKSVSFNWTINAATGKPIKGDHGKCLDDSGAGTANGTKVDIWTCNNTVAQQWTFTSGALSVQGKCLDDSSQGGTGSKLVIWTCNGHNAQIWTHRSNGEYVLKLNNLCLTDPSGSTVNGTQVQVRTCNDFADQQWTGP